MLCDPVATLASEHRIPLIGETSLASVESTLRRLRPACIVISSYNRLIRPEVLELCPFINVHYGPLPRYRGRANVNWAILNHESETAITIHAIDSDLATFQDRPLDHGCNSPLSMLWPHEPDWPGALVPIQVNVLQYPLPTALRCYKLGQSIRRAIESYPGDLDVAIVGTGGLSHQIHGERAGFNNTEWDMRFLELIERDPMQLARMKHADFIRLGGAESVEVIMWLAMRGALSPAARITHSNYYLATSTAMTVALFEEPPQSSGADGLSQAKNLESAA